MQAYAETQDWLGEESRYRLLIESITDYAIFLLDARGVVASWNAGAAKLKGYTEAEILGQHFSHFYTSEDQAAGLPARALATAEREGRMESEGWRLRKDGTRFWAHVIVDPIRDETGRLLGFAKITRDLTERRATQEALERAQRALFQAQKMESIGQLTGGIAHDFNNLLMVILGSLELIGKRLPHDPRVTPLVENATLAAQRGAALTQRMLAFARRQELKLEPVDAPQVVAGIFDLLRRSMGPSHVLRTSFPQPLPPVMTDVNQLESALLNLAVNARDAMPDGGTIHISGREVVVDEEEPESTLRRGRYVCLTVADTGAGMDASTLARAAEPFFTTKGVGKGSGLGLSMVQGLAEQSGGGLKLFSEPGRGTKVDLYLPSVAGVDAVQPSRPNTGRREVVTRSGLHVLAVDDDALVLLNTKAMLEDLGHDVYAAHSGQEALQVLERGDPVDVVISDQAMPHMTGLQLRDSMRGRWPEIPFLLATGYAELSGQGDGLPRLAKPFTQAELAAAVERLTVQEEGGAREMPGAVAVAADATHAPGE